MLPGGEAREAGPPHPPPPTPPPRLLHLISTIYLEELTVLGHQTRSWNGLSKEPINGTVLQLFMGPDAFRAKFKAIGMAGQPFGV